MVQRIFRSIFIGRRKWLTWGLIMAVSITIPLMVLNTNMISMDISILNNVWDMIDNRTSGNGSDHIWADEKKSIFPHRFNKTTPPPPFRWCPLRNRSSEIDCDKLFNDDQSAIDRYRLWTPPCTYTEFEMSRIACDCERLKKTFHFQNESMSEEEYDFPLAFITIVEKNPEQVLRLLSSIYQPQNIYCFTYDQHSTEEFKRTLRCLEKCFDNVILPRYHYEIFWADISILDATLECMKSLIDRGDWRYVQILSWNDLPLKTNLEMVRIFRIFDGASDSELSFGQAERYRKFHFQGGLDSRRSEQINSIPPDGLIIYKGSFAVSLSKEFCQFLIADPVAVRFKEWSRSMWAPEEQFWSTMIHNTQLNHNSSFPGSCLNYYEMEKKEKFWISRYQIWSEENCRGKMVSGSCCFGLGDLKKLKKQNHLVAHKFYSDYEPATWYCMLKWHYEKTYQVVTDLNTSFYENLQEVRYQKMIKKDIFTC